MEEKTIKSKGQSKVSAEADQANIQYTILARDKNQSTVAEQLKDKSERMKSALDSEGLDDYYSVRYDIREKNQDENQKESEYVGIHSYRLSLDDVDSVGSVIDTLTNNSVDEIKNVAFKLSDDTYNRCRKKAIKRAMGNARMEAKAAAQAESYNISGVYSVDVDKTHRRTRGNNNAVMLSSIPKEETTTNIKKGDVDVSAEVLVKYNITT